jgi:hypothetical protein
MEYKTDISSMPVFKNFTRTKENSEGLIRCGKYWKREQKRSPKMQA